MSPPLSPNQPTECLWAATATAAAPAASNWDWACNNLVSITVTGLFKRSFLACWWYGLVLRSIAGLGGTLRFCGESWCCLVNYPCKFVVPVQPFRKDVERLIEEQYSGRRFLHHNYLLCFSHCHSEQALYFYLVWLKEFDSAALEILNGCILGGIVLERTVDLGVIIIGSSKNHCLGFNAPHVCWFFFFACYGWKFGKLRRKISW